MSITGSTTGIPNKWAGFTTNDVKSADEFAAKLSELYAQGYTGPVVVVGATSHGGEWVAVAGYTQGPVIQPVEATKPGHAAPAPAVVQPGPGQQWKKKRWGGVK